MVRIIETHRIDSKRSRSVIKRCGTVRAVIGHLHTELVGVRVENLALRQLHLETCTFSLRQGLDADKRTVALIGHCQRGRLRALVERVTDVVLLVLVPAVGIAYGQVGRVTGGIDDGALLSAILAIAKTDFYWSLNGDGEYTVYPSMVRIIEADCIDGKRSRSVIKRCGTVSAVAGHLHTEFVGVRIEDVALRQLHLEIGKGRCTLRHS